MNEQYLWLVIATFLISLVISSKLLWPARLLLSSLNVVLIGVSVGLLLVANEGLIFSVTLAILQLFHLFSILRLAHRPSRYIELRKRHFISSLWLSCMLTAFILSIAIIEEYSVTGIQLLGAIVTLQFVVALVFLFHTRDAVAKSRFQSAKKMLSDKNLPTITVAIPARNETAELEDCLESILESDYPKMEILVLDDCSQDTTPQIIRDFAHRGVRFIEGKAPAQSWLAKNYAYQQLLDESQGRYVLFCGVDVRFAKTDLRTIFSRVLAEKTRVCSILPSRPKAYDDGFILQPLRYYRELVLPKIFSRVPPVISTVWLAERSFLSKSGGFGAAKKTIRPERFFARLGSRSGSYSFFLAGSGLGLYSVKSLKAQWNTAVRTRYPESGNQIERIIVSSVWYAVFFLSPGLICIASVIYGFPAYILLLSLLASLVLLYIQARVCRAVSGSISMRKVVLFPVSVILEIIVMIYSMWAYEFSEVVWKGRNVCRPVLTTIPRLPKIR